MLLRKGEAPSSKTAVTEHLLDTGHTATYDDFSIIFQAKNECQLNAAEAYAIHKLKPELNCQKYLENELHIAW